MLSRAIVLKLLSKVNMAQINQMKQVMPLSTSATLNCLPGVRLEDRIGNREIVGHGVNGTPSYIDHIDFPYPAIRFKEDTPETKILREKEKGDWNNLTIDEKKKLYRLSFRQTYAEFLSGYGEWKIILAGVLSLAAFSLYLYVGLILTCDFPYPQSFTEESKSAQLQRMIDLRIGYMKGPASKYDYENKKWKD